MFSDYIYIITPVLGWLVAQGIKFVFFLRKDGIRISDAWQSGGMPSSHAAFIVSIATLVGLNEGFDSALFGVIAAVAAIILYDAIGVRRVTGENSAAIHEIAKKQKLKLTTRLHGAKGHSPLEVAAGAVLGVIIGFLAYNLL
jgi:acid phosphatase family membrane protein YuiD